MATSAKKLSVAAAITMTVSNPVYSLNWVEVPLTGMGSIVFFMR